MSEEEIIEYCTYRLFAPVRTGRYIDTYGKLTPGTEYYAIAYGNYNGEITTELFLEPFETNATCHPGGLIGVQSGIRTVV